MLGVVRIILLFEFVIDGALMLGALAKLYDLLRTTSKDYTMFRRCLWGMVALVVGALTSIVGITVTLILYWDPVATSPGLASWRVCLWQAGALSFFAAFCAFFRFDIHEEIRDDLRNTRFRDLFQ